MRLEFAAASDSTVTVGWLDMQLCSSFLTPVANRTE